MQWADHSKLSGMHAFLGASKYSWLNYSPQKLVEVYEAQRQKEIGTRLHAFAAECIRLRQKLPKSRKTLNAYVNDAIGFRMRPEQVLYYSPVCFGTADAISFDRNVLRIFDLKTGVTPAKMEQLLIYDALFCLEYGVNAADISFENRIYQSDDIIGFNPVSNDVQAVIDKIKEYSSIISELEYEALGDRA